MMRLDKYLAEMGVGTRQEVKKQIRQGKAAVNGTVAGTYLMYRMNIIC